jgi:hypothetical protein
MDRRAGLLLVTALYYGNANPTVEFTCPAEFPTLALNLPFCPAVPSDPGKKTDTVVDPPLAARLGKLMGRTEVVFVSVPPEVTFCIVANWSV